MKKDTDYIKDEICKIGFTGVPETVYGPMYKEHLLKQYDIYIQTLNHNSDTRQKIHSYFLTLNTLLLTALGISFVKESAFVTNGGQVAIPFIGLIVCMIWWVIIYSYKQQAIVKNIIIQCLEDYLPLSPYSAEWDVLKSKHTGIKNYFNRISLLIPWVFVMLYVFIILFSF